MQIDWISGVIECPKWGQMGYSGFDTGQVLALDPDGSLQRIGSGKLFVDGSHDSSLRLVSSRGHDLFISGNPVKHIQGHNLFGSDDAVALFLEAGVRIRQGIGCFPGPRTWDAEGFVGPRFTRLDLTRSYRFGSQGAAREWIRHVGGSARSRHGGAIVRGETVYLGNNSERWSFKIYSKFDELQSRRKGHDLSPALTDRAREQLLAWSEGVVRFELTLRAKELEKLVRNFETLRVWSHYFVRITLNRNAEMKKADLVEESLRLHLKRALAAWRGGADLRKLYKTSQFYKVRSELLSAIGVDVAGAAPVEQVASGSVGGLEENRWDPEPLEEHFFHPDAKLKDLYAAVVEAKVKR